MELPIGTEPPVAVQDDHGLPSVIGRANMITVRVAAGRSQGHAALHPSCWCRPCACDATVGNIAAFARKALHGLKAAKIPGSMLRIFIHLHEWSILCVGVGA